MTARELLTALDGAGVLLTPGTDSGRLRVNAPAGALTQERRRALVEHKAELLELLYEREERAALQGAPAGCDAALWLKAANHPAVRAVLERFGAEIVEVRRTR
jgi:hypothetical protein